MISRYTIKIILAVLLMFCMYCDGDRTTHSSLKGGDIGDLSFEKFNMTCVSLDPNEPIEVRVTDIPPDDGAIVGNNPKYDVLVKIKKKPTDGDTPGVGAGNSEELGESHIARTLDGSDKFAVSVAFSQGQVSVEGDRSYETETGWEGLPGEITFNSDHRHVKMICGLEKRTE